MVLVMLLLLLCVVLVLRFGVVGDDCVDGVVAAGVRGDGDVGVVVASHVGIVVASCVIRCIMRVVYVGMCVCVGVVGCVGVGGGCVAIVVGVAGCVSVANVAGWWAVVDDGIACVDCFVYVWGGVVITVLWRCRVYRDCVVFHWLCWCYRCDLRWCYCL